MATASKRQKVDDVIDMVLSGDILNWKPTPPDRFHDSLGRLTPYAFACGYVEEDEQNGIRITLWKEGGYHVRAYDHGQGTRLFWETYPKLSRARIQFARLKRKYFI